MIGPDGRISYQSPSIERLLGYDADDMVGRRFDELIDRSDRDRVRQKLDDAAVLGREEPEVAPVQPGAPGRRAASVRGELHQPARRRARRRHRAQLPRHQRAQGVRGAAHAPGVPRPGDRPREPGAVRRARPACDRAHAPRAPAASPSSSWTSTTSRRSTTASVMPPATRCSSRWPSGSPRASARPTRPRASAATSSPLLLEDIEGVQEAADTADRVLEALALPLARCPQGALAALQHRHLRRLRGHAGAAPRS